MTTTGRVLAHPRSFFRRRTTKSLVILRRDLTLDRQRLEGEPGEAAGRDHAALTQQLAWIEEELRVRVRPSTWKEARRPARPAH